MLRIESFHNKLTQFPYIFLISQRILILIELIKTYQRGYVMPIDVLDVF